MGFYRDGHILKYVERLHFVEHVNGNVNFFFIIFIQPGNVGINIGNHNLGGSDFFCTIMRSKDNDFFY